MARPRSPSMNGSRPPRAGSVSPRGSPGEGAATVWVILQSLSAALLPRRLPDDPYSGSSHYRGRIAGCQDRRREREGIAARRANRIRVMARRPLMRPDTQPIGLYEHPGELALATDLYELTMAAAYFEHGMTAQAATFELFVRHLPAERGYLVAAGLEQAIQYLTRLRFDAAARDYLRSLPVFEQVSDGFWDYLREFRFTGDLSAMPEGTIAFANEPLLQVRAPLIEAQMVETALLAIMNHQTLIATKAARVVEAAQGRTVVEFGARRAHGLEAGLHGARAAVIGGCVGTSNVLAGHAFDIPVYGTAAHSFTMSFPHEIDAFRAYHQTFPGHDTLLIDTYDTREGARRAVRVGQIAGVRLDSGDLTALSIQ